MMIETAKGISQVKVNTMHGAILVLAGMPQDVPEDLARQLIAEGKVRRTDIPWIQNSQVIIVDMDAVRPVGVPERRDA